MRPVNLIPPEERRGDRAPVRTGALPYLLIGAVAVAVVAVALLTLVGNQISERETSLASLEAQEQAVSAEAQALAPYAQFAALSAARTETVTSLAQSRFDWERVMRELARVTPDDVWLTKLGGAASGAAEGASESGDLASGVTGPTLSITGCGDGHEAVARYLAALQDIDGVTRVGVSKSELKDEESTGTAAGATSGEAGGEDCRVRNFITQFEIVAAFDAVVPAVPSEPAPAAPAEPTAANGAGTPEEQQAADAIQNGTDKAKKASEIIPGVAP